MSRGTKGSACSTGFFSTPKNFWALMSQASIGHIPFLSKNQQCKRTEGNAMKEPLPRLPERERVLLTSSQLSDASTHQKTQ